LDYLGEGPGLKPLLLRSGFRGLKPAATPGEVEAEVAADVVDSYGDEEVVDVVSAEVGVAAGGDDFEDAFVELEDGDVEGAAAEVVDGDDAVLLLVEAVCERGGGGFVDETEDVEAGDAASVLCGLALGVVKVGGNGDDGARDGRAEEALGVLLELEKDVSGDLWRREGEAAYVELEDFVGLQAFGELEGEELELGLDVGEVAAHEALDRVDGVGGVGEQDATCGVANSEPGGSVLVEGDDRGDDGGAVFAGDDDGRFSLHEGDEGVGGSEVNTDDGAGCGLVCVGHCFVSCFLVLP
jgi:hypothetical protein